MIKFYYYNLKTKKNLIFKSKNRDTAIARLEKETGEPWYVIDRKLKSDLQLGVTMPFRTQNE